MASETVMEVILINFLLGWVTLVWHVFNTNTEVMGHNMWLLWTNKKYLAVPKLGQGWVSYQIQLVAMQPLLSVWGSEKSVSLSGQIWSILDASVSASNQNEIYQQLLDAVLWHCVQTLTGSEKLKPYSLLLSHHEVRCWTSSCILLHPPLWSGQRCGVNCKLDYVIGTINRGPVVGEEGVEQRAQHTALLDISV